MPTRKRQGVLHILKARTRRVLCYAFPVLHVSHPEAWLRLLRSPAGLLLVIVFAVFDPLVTSYLFRRLKGVPVSRAGAMRLRVYASIIVLQWLYTVVVVAALYRFGLKLTDIGLQIGNAPASLLTTLGLLGLIVWQALPSRKKKKPLSKEELEKAVGGFMLLLPRTPRERGFYVVLGLTAGICEEFCYRGFLLSMFAGATASLAAGVLVSSIIFSLGHAYQGKRGMLSTGVVGLVFALMFVFTRSLIPGQVLHAAVDILNGLKIGAKLGPVEAG
ncbi:MAG: CPBP family intramembrane metalloprotease [Acidobacteriales bacterium]|nr:CPBP family intramembrane metalloprotease [Terriglobales bacterium]